MAEPPIIEVRDLVYTYPGAPRPALQEVSFEVFRGEIFGLLGPSGAGKSTLQRVLTRQLKKHGGEVRVLARALEAWGPAYFEHIGVGFELPNHFPRLTALENLAFFSALYPGRTQDPEPLLAALGLERAKNQRVGEFSKGMKMRLNFVRAIQHDPEILFLDEPTAGLDPVSAAALKALLRRLQSEGKTIMLTTHNMSDVDALCERVGFMVGGQMRSLDHRKALKARYGRREIVVEHGPETHPQEARFPLDGLAQNRDFLHLLDSQSVISMHSQEATLDRVFAEVTGAQLHGGEPDEA